MGVPKKEQRAAWLAAETEAEKKRRGSLVLRRLDKVYPGARVALEYSSPLELVVATALSAQCTDAKVNEVTRELFKKYRKPEDYLAATPGELEADIKPTGFFNQKARNLRGMARVLLDEFGGEVPDTMEDLQRLPGVARKTANIVLSGAFGKVEGIAVDTHVHRLSYRLGLSDHADANKVERDLMALFPKAKWPKVTHLLILHGRTVCKAPKPRCEDCAVADKCPASRLPERRVRSKR